MTGAQLKAIRESRGLNQKGLAAQLKTSVQNVSHWENDTHKVPAWVETELLRSVNVNLPMEDLVQLVEVARRDTRTVDSIIGDALRAYIADHHRPSKEVATVVKFSDESSSDDKVAEEP